jgi:hypothetical protein
MCGAVGYHVKARDNVVAMLPAVLTAAACAAVVVLAAGATGGSLLPNL